MEYENNGYAAAPGKPSGARLEYRDMKLDRADVFTAAALVLCGFVYWNFGILTVSAGISVFLFTILICAVIYAYLKGKGYRQSRQSLLCLACILALALSYVIYDVPAVQTLGVLVLQGLFVYWIAIATRTRIRNDLSVYVVGDFFKQIFVIPFSNFLSGPAAIGNAGRGRKISRALLLAAAGVVIIIPVAWIVITLLTAADAAFGSIMGNIRALFDLDWTEYLVQFILGIPAALYIFGLAFGDANKNAHGRSTITRESMDEKSQRIHCLPVALACTAMTVLNVIYAVFMAVQASYLFSASRGILPAGSTYADYARSGFFQLCAVAVINLAVVICAQSFVKRSGEKTAPAVRIETIIISLFTIGLAATALRKMYLYIEAYGLTQLRVYTTLFMIFLAAVFAAAAVRQVKAFNATAAAAVMALVMMFTFAYGNIDGQIAKYNLHRYEAGTLKLMDEETLASLGDGAVPYLNAAYRNMPAGEPKDRLYTAMTGLPAGQKEARVQAAADQTSWKNWNLQSARAGEIRDSLSAK